MAGRKITRPRILLYDARMPNSATSAAPKISANQSLAGAFLGCLSYLYWWVTITPFADLSGAPSLLASEAGSNLLNQFIALAMFAAMLVIGLQPNKRSLLSSFSGVLLLMFVWLAVASLVGHVEAVSFRRLTMAFVVCVCANVFLLLPRSQAQFAGMLVFSSFVILALSFFGVAFLPSRSIHLDTDVLEPLLAGDWRGLFSHKNAAAPAMVVTIFIGLYYAGVQSRLVGLLLAAAAVVFLYKTGGKTALGLLPVTLIVAWLVEKLGAMLRWTIIVATVGGYGLVTLGSAAFKPIKHLVASLGIDESFTGRTEIWTVALDAIRAKPIFGYGYENFWGSEQVVYGIREEGTWAVTAPTAHNAYLDLAVAGGLVGLAIALIWLVVIPTRHISSAVAADARPGLTRLFIRVWIFCLLLGHLESFYFGAGGGLWFFMMVAVFGLGMQARVGRLAIGQRTALRRAS
ncbi:MAG: O-antigen ligase [Devosia sp.]|nr:O-antigen ligase [Devosia sp.]